VLGLALSLAPAAHAQQPSVTVPPVELKAYETVKNAPDAPAALAAAKAFLAQYPESKAAPQLPIDVSAKIFAMPQGAERIKQVEAFKAAFPSSDIGLDLEFASMPYYFQEGNTAEIYRIGEAFLAKHPNDVEANFLLLRGAVDALRRSDTSYAEKGKSYGSQAIVTLEKPETPPRFKSADEWKKYQSENLADAYQSIGLIGLATNDVTLAGEYLEKARSAKPKDPLTLFFLANLRYLEYNIYAKRFNATTDRESPDAKQALETANAKLDAVNELLLQTVAVAESDPKSGTVAQQAKAMLEEAWKQRHDGKLDGMDAAIQRAKGGN
jgi:hypothetical protein